MQQKDRDKVGEALMKVALGFQVAEVTEEYAEIDGALKLTKRKRTKKDVPPDLKAVQLLLENSGGAGVEQMTDEELLAERERLLSALEKTKAAGQVCVERKKTTVKKKTAKKSAAKNSVKK